MSDAPSTHEHDVSCAFGNPTCPAFAETPAEPPRGHWLHAHLRRCAVQRWFQADVEGDDEPPACTCDDDEPDYQLLYEATARNIERMARAPGRVRMPSEIRRLDAGRKDT